MKQVLIILFVALVSAQRLPYNQRDVNPNINYPSPSGVPFQSGGLFRSRASTDDEKTIKLSTRGTHCEDGFTCTPYYLCNDGKVPSRNSGTIHIRLSGDDMIPCPQSLDACCKEVDQVEEPLITPEPTTNECGFRKPEGVGALVTSDAENITQFGEFPWTIAVLRKFNEDSGEPGPQFLCGGSMIHPLVVITAAHCVAGHANNVLTMRAGEWDTQTENELLKHQDRDVAQVIIHEGYDKGNLRNDVALVFLQTPFELAENVKPVCLPPEVTDFSFKRCIATGWGKDRFGRTGRFSVIQRKVELPVVPNGDCETRLRTTRLGQYFELNQSFLCAGGNSGEDTCRGDGGSPLVCPIPGKTNQYYLAGIVAWGLGCGEADIPGVYVKVSEFKTWIDMIVRDKGLAVETYSPIHVFS